MTSAEHYRLAERLEEQALHWYHDLPSGLPEPDADRQYGLFLAIRAQIHASLAAAPDPKAVRI